MLVCNIDLHRYGTPPNYELGDRLAKVIIWNDGTGNSEIANYEVRLVVGDAPDKPSQLIKGDILGNCLIIGWTRERPVVELLYRALWQLIGDLSL